MSDAAVMAVGSVIVASISALGLIQSSKAAKNSKPVSNGFAEGVRTDLREIREMLFSHIDGHK
jgi:branched-subunit amino acid permease